MGRAEGINWTWNSSAMGLWSLMDAQSWHPFRWSLLWSPSSLFLPLSARWRPWSVHYKANEWTLDNKDAKRWDLVPVFWEQTKLFSFFVFRYTYRHRYTYIYMYNLYSILHVYIHLTSPWINIYDFFIIHVRIKLRIIWNIETRMPTTAAPTRMPTIASLFQLDSEWI